MAVLIFAPNASNIAEQAAFATFVRWAGQVEQRGLAERVANAFALVTMIEAGELIGTAAIKQRDLDYRARLFRKAGVEEQAAAYPLELGWVHVHPNREDAGRGRELVGAALDAAKAHGGAIYATTKAPAMHHILSHHFGFARLGFPYQSMLEPSTKLSLYVRPI